MVNWPDLCGQQKSPRSRRRALKAATRPLVYIGMNMRVFSDGMESGSVRTRSVLAAAEKSRLFQTTLSLVNSEQRLRGDGTSGSRFQPHFEATIADKPNLSPIRLSSMRAVWKVSSVSIDVRQVPASVLPFPLSVASLRRGC